MSRGARVSAHGSCPEAAAARGSSKRRAWSQPPTSRRGLSPRRASECVRRARKIIGVPGFAAFLPRGMGCPRGAPVQTHRYARVWNVCFFVLRIDVRHSLIPLHAFVTFKRHGWIRVVPSLRRRPRVCQADMPWHMPTRLDAEGCHTPDAVIWSRMPRVPELWETLRSLDRQCAECRRRWLPRNPCPPYESWL